ncbi:hypothetical protein KGY77_09830 [Candidatus Bipolaricaulota bacterium]|nr:hypothetical protein [Candidatus Bipolaricaulota bacterium]
MIKRKLKLVSPLNSAGAEASGKAGIFSSIVTHDEEKDVYATVEKFRQEVFPRLTGENFREKVVTEPVPLSAVINLHNADEINRRETSIGEMRDKIQSGGHVLMPDGLPNVKIAKTMRDELVCFDGHHSLLAYMLAGKRYLQEVPHLMVTGESGDGLRDEEFHVFFGEHEKKLRGSGWRNYTISWTNPPDRQLEERKQEDMGELFSALGKG